MKKYVMGHILIINMFVLWTKIVTHVILVKYIKKDVIAYRMTNIVNGTQISKSANQSHVKTYKFRQYVWIVKIVNTIRFALQNANTIIINNFVKKINAIGIHIIKNALSVILISAMIQVAQMTSVANLEKLNSMVKPTKFVLLFVKK